MNWDQVKGSWKQLKGKTQWGQPWCAPTDDDEPGVMEGKREELLHRLRGKYGYTKPDLSLPAKVYQAKRYLYPHESEQEAMRSDWEKIGGDFRVSIAKAERETTAE